MDFPEEPEPPNPKYHIVAPRVRPPTIGRMSRFTSPKSIEEMSRISESPPNRPSTYSPPKFNPFPYILPPPIAPPTYIPYSPPPYNYTAHQNPPPLHPNQWQGRGTMLPCPPEKYSPYARDECPPPFGTFDSPQTCPPETMPPPNMPPFRNPQKGGPPFGEYPPPIAPQNIMPCHRTLYPRYPPSPPISPTPKAPPETISPPYGPFRRNYSRDEYPPYTLIDNRPYYNPDLAPHIHGQGFAPQPLNRVPRMVHSTPYKPKIPVQCADMKDLLFSNLAPIHTIYDHIQEINDSHKIRLFYDFPAARYFLCKPSGKEEQIFGQEAQRMMPYSYFLYGYAILEILILKESEILLKIMEKRLKDALISTAGPSEGEDIFSALNNRFFNDECMKDILYLISQVKMQKNNKDIIEAFQNLVINNPNYKRSIIIMVKSAIAEMRDRAKQNDLAMQIIKENYYLISEDLLKDLSEAFHIKITTHYKADKNSFGKLSVVPRSGSIILRPEIHVFHRTKEEIYDFILYTKELLLEILPDDWEKKVAEDKKYLDNFELLPPDLKTYLTNPQLDLVTFILENEEKYNNIANKQIRALTKIFEDEISRLSDETEKFVISSGYSFEVIEKFLVIFDKYVESKVFLKNDFERVLNTLSTLIETTNNLKTDDASEERIKRINEKFLRMKDNTVLDKIMKIGHEMSNQNRMYPQGEQYFGGGMQMNMQSASPPNIPVQPMAMMYNQEMNPPAPMPKVSCKNCQQPENPIFPKLEKCVANCQLNLCALCLSKKLSTNHSLQEKQKQFVLYIACCPSCFSEVSANDLQRIQRNLVENYATTGRFIPPTPIFAPKYNAYNKLTNINDEINRKTSRNFEEVINRFSDEAKKLMFVSEYSFEIIEQFLVIFDKYVESKVFLKIDDFESVLNTLGILLKNTKSIKNDDACKENIERITEKSLRMKSSDFLNKIMKVSKEIEILIGLEIYFKETIFAKNKEVEECKTKIENLNKNIFNLTEESTILKDINKKSEIMIKEKDSKVKQIEMKVSNLTSKQRDLINEKEEIINYFTNMKIKILPGIGSNEILKYLVPPTQFEDTKEHEKGQNPVYFYTDINSKNHERVALKLTKIEETGPENSQIKNLLKAEFSSMLKCSRSPYVSRPISFCENQDYVGILMEDGGIPLKYWYRMHNDQFIDNCIKGFNQLAQCLEFIHKEHIYHGDIKPANVLFKNDIFKLTDFGSSVLFDNTYKFHEERNTISLIRECTPLFIPPELISKIQNQPLAYPVQFEKIDVFSLAFTMYVAIIRGKLKEEQKLKNDLTNYHLFLQKAAENLEAVLTAEQTDKKLKDNLIGLICKCLDRDPKERPSPQEIIDNLNIY